MITASAILCKRLPNALGDRHNTECHMLSSAAGRILFWSIDYGIPDSW